MVDRKVVKKRDDGSVIYRLDRDARKGNYYVNAESSQAKYLSEVTLHDFSTFPKTLYPTGFGFKVTGAQLLKELHDKYGAKLRVTLSASADSSINVLKRSVRVIINEQSLVTVNRVASQIKRKRNDEIKAVVGAFLGSEFPVEFYGRDTGLLAYKPNTIAELLEDENVMDTLSERDENALKSVYPKIIGGAEFTLRSGKQVKIISDGIKTSQKVYLEKTIEEFESKIAGSSSENVWQKFLHKHILTLLNVYAFVIEKQSVEIDGKYPDFMLMDAYGYLDIYEIKKPQTGLLKYDKSRNNYYWDTDLSKAVIQTEKYISSVERNKYELESKLRKSGSEARIVRPRGFIIAGLRSQLKSDGMQEDFRVLNDSLKNVDVICFDDLLDNLVVLRERLTSET